MGFGMSIESFFSHGLAQLEGFWRQALGAPLPFPILFQVLVGYSF